MTATEPSALVPETPETDVVQSSYIMAGLVQHIFSLAAAQGIPVTEILSTTSLTPGKLAEPNARIPAALFEQLVCIGIKRSSDPLLGLHMAEQGDPAVFGVLGYLLRACSTLQEVIELTTQYESLGSDLSHTSLQHQPGLALWCWRYKSDNLVFRRHATEYLMGIMLAIRSRLIRHTSLILAVHLEHAPPADTTLFQEYQRVYGCPVLFNQPISAVVLSSVALKEPLTHSDVTLLDVLEQHARQLIDQGEKNASFLEHAKAQLRTLVYQGNASKELLAQTLEISSRHLHRQLHMHGYNYKKLHDELRFDIACRHLQDSSDSIEHIARKIKFSESQSFIRWFRKVSGKTPGQYRQDNKGDTP